MKIMKAPRVRLAVTDELIADAVRGDSGHCMVAEALKEALPYAKHVSVDIQTIRFSDSQTRARYIYLTPRIAQEALVKFDEGDPGNPVEPFRCELRNPHITAMQSRKPGGTRQPRSEAQQAAMEKLQEGRHPTVEPREGKTPKLVPDAGHQPGPKGGGSALPRVEGGQPPPMGALASGKQGRVPAGRRRQYGIRALDRGSKLLLKDKGE